MCCKPVGGPVDLTTLDEAIQADYLHSPDHPVEGREALPVRIAAAAEVGFRTVAAERLPEILLTARGVDRPARLDPRRRYHRSGSG